MLFTRPDGLQPPRNPTHPTLPTPTPLLAIPQPTYSILAFRLGLREALGEHVPASALLPCAMATSSERHLRTARGSAVCLMESSGSARANRTTWHDNSSSSSRLYFRATFKVLPLRIILAAGGFLAPAFQPSMSWGISQEVRTVGASIIRAATVLQPLSRGMFCGFGPWLAFIGHSSGLGVSKNWGLFFGSPNKEDHGIWGPI